MSSSAAPAALARSGGRRLGLALGGIAVTVGTLAAAAVLLTTQFEPDGLAYIPSGTPVVVELRPNLPGSQREALGALLGRIPAMSFGTNAGDRIDAALDHLVRTASDGKHTYADVRPYTAGPIFVAIPAEAAEAAGGPAVTSGSQAAPMLVVLAPQGAPGCQGLEDGVAVTIERYRDVDLRIPAPDARRPACAAPGSLVLLGDPRSLRAALDAKAAGRSVTDDPTYQAAAAAVTDDAAAWQYVDGPSAARLAVAAAQARASARPSASSSTPGDPASDAPEWVATALRFVAEGVIVETVMPDPRPAILAGASQSPRVTTAPDAVSAIAPILPATTIVAVEVHQAGPLFAAMAARVPTAATGLPGAGSTTDLSQLGPALSLLGGGAVLGSVDQAVLAVIRQGSSTSGGIVLRTTDADGGKARVDLLRSFLALAVPGIAETDYRGTRILTLPLAALAGAGGTGTLPVPGTGTSPATTPLGGLTLVVAAHRSAVVVGLGDIFVKAVIDTPAGSALADQAVYRATIGLAGGTTFAQAYVDLPALLDLVKPRLPTDRVEVFGRDIRPYLAPIAAVAMGATSSGGLARSRVVIYVP